VRVGSGRGLSVEGGASQGPPGRWCPPSYGLGPAAFLAGRHYDADVVYVVGGLYGNPFALSRLVQLFDAEPATRKLFILNGDFHWFDRDEATFAYIEHATAPFVRLRGNVETEIAAPGDDAGCGCAYPASVPDEDVDRSNVILGELKQVARATGCDQALGALPAVARVSCGGLHMAVTHGDDRSLAGWDFACDRLDDTWRDGLGNRMRTLGVSLIASSHTCLAVADARLHEGQLRAVVNNGSAGMANFRGDPSGLFTRVAAAGWADACDEGPLYRAAVGGADVAAVPVRFDAFAWQSYFLQRWPEGSAAHTSYWRRILGGPAHHPDNAARGLFQRHV